MPAQKAKDLEIQGTNLAIVATDFDEFDDEFSRVDFSDYAETNPTKQIPAAQIVTTATHLTRFSETPEKDLPYGLFIPLDQAENAGFTPDANWIFESPCLGGKAVSKFGGSGSTPGYFVRPGKMARIVVLAMSLPEVYTKKKIAGNNSTVCLGPYFTCFDASGPVKSEAGLAFDSAEKNTGWQKSVRYLFYPLGENNEPLSDRPLSVRISNTFGVGFKIELKATQNELIAASVANGERKKAQSIAKAEYAKAKAIENSDVQGGILADTELKAAKRKGVQSLTNADRPRVVLCFGQSMRENVQGIGTVFLSSRLNPTIWLGGEKSKPAPFSVDQKKGTEILYALGIEPTAYYKLIVDSKSDFGQQITADLETYADYKVAPNLRKLLKETPATTAPMPDFDPNADYEFEYVPDEETTELESDPLFKETLIQLGRAVEVEQVEKWRQWAMKPNRAGLFTHGYPTYEQDLMTLAARHIKTLS